MELSVHDIRYLKKCLYENAEILISQKLLAFTALYRKCNSLKFFEKKLFANVMIYYGSIYKQKLETRLPQMSVVESVEV